MNLQNKYSHAQDIWQLQILTRLTPMASYNLGSVKNTLQMQNPYAHSKVLETKPLVVGGGTNGASVNLTQHTSIKSKFQNYLPWIYWSWYCMH